MQRITKLLNNKVAFLLIAIFIGFLVAGLVLGFTGYNPIEVYSILFKGMFSKPRYIMNIIIKATPIILTGISVTFALRVGLFNIGVEGQYIVGTIAATVAGIIFDFPPIIQYPLIIIIGALAGGIYGGIAGYLKAKRGIHEVITGIMFNWIAFYFGNYVVSLDRFHEPGTTTTYIINSSGLDPIYNWKMSEAGQAILQQNDFLREIVGRTSANIGIIFAILVAILITFFVPTAISGHGFIALTAIIFGKWKPVSVYLSCLFFGLAQAIVIQLGGGEIFSSQIMAMLPYLLTIIVLVLFVGRSTGPKASGVPYEKGN